MSGLMTGLKRLFVPPAEPSPTRDDGSFMRGVMQVRQVMANRVVEIVERDGLDRGNPELAQAIRCYRRTFQPYDGVVIVMAGWEAPLEQPSQATALFDWMLMNQRWGDA